MSMQPLRLGAVICTAACAGRMEHRMPADGSTR
jgi:hypothetical protein